jgi:hypothetical protein
VTANGGGDGVSRSWAVRGGFIKRRREDGAASGVRAVDFEGGGDGAVQANRVIGDRAEHDACTQLSWLELGWKRRGHNLIFDGLLARFIARVVIPANANEIATLRHVRRV